MAASDATRAGHVAIVGRPNVGKSTLLNRLMGQRLSITSRKPQTTRHRVLGIVNVPGAQCAFVDTPGFQSGHTNALGAAMNRTVLRALADVDVIVLVLVAGRWTTEDEQVMKLLPSAIPRIAAVNKVDQFKERSLLLPFLAQVERRMAPRAIVPISARQGYQTSVLLREIAASLPVQPAIYPEDQLTDRDERFFAAEFIREKIFRLLGDELPYAITVVIDKFEQTTKLRRIHATVFVDKASHRAIVLGQEGERMKEIASSARKDMETMFGGKVFLQIWVKVRRGWANDAGELQRLGYE